MSYAPRTLLDARAYLLAELDAQPGVPRHADLEADEVGIIGNLATHFGGYHVGWDRLLRNLGLRDYSVAESPRDAKPTDAASALDIGLFDVRRGGRRLTLPHMSLWIVEQCKAGAPDTRDIREVIYSPDGKVVHRWDRLGIRTGGDLSHLGHTHCSYFRDSEHRDKISLFRRYIEGDDDMPYTQWPKADRQALVDDVATAVAKRRNPSNDVALGTMVRRSYEQRGKPTEILAVLGELSGQVAALSSLVERFAAGEAVQLTAEQLEELAAAVTASGQDTAAKILARLSAAGAALADAEGPDEP